MTIHEIQKISLDILKYFHNFCVDNNLRYSLDGGTLIGAIRHEGFIPWDDDVDILMPRSDYNVFCEKFVDNEDFALFCADRGNSKIAYARLCERKRTLVSQSLPWTDDITGIWIDIFPADLLPDDRKLAEEHVQKIKIQYNWQKRIRELNKKVDASTSIVWRLKRIVKKVIYPIIAKAPLKKQIELLTMYQSTTTRYWAQVAFMDDDYVSTRIQTVNDWQSLLLFPFETEQFYVMNGYDSYLTNQYGDYMKLPPEDQRCPCHTFANFNWKE